MCLLTFVKGTWFSVCWSCCLVFVDLVCSGNVVCVFVDPVCSGNVVCVFVDPVCSGNVVC